MKFTFYIETTTSGRVTLEASDKAGAYAKIKSFVTSVGQNIEDIPGIIMNQDVEHEINLVA